VLESLLHTELKNTYTQSGDVQEAQIDGYLVDVKHGDLLIEIQTRHFSAIKPKLQTLLRNHPVLLVHPISYEKWIVRQDEAQISRRRSPRRGRWEDLFYELVSIPHLLDHPNFSLEILLVRVEEIRKNDGKGSWRRKGWSIVERTLLEIVDRRRYLSTTDYLDFLPSELNYPFTSHDLAQAASIAPELASKMVYCLRHMGELEITGKRGRSYLYSLSA
jgi:hypothetical protein